LLDSQIQVRPSAELLDTGIPSRDACFVYLSIMSSPNIEAFW
jgi:hypothetical protein